MMHHMSQINDQWSDDAVDDDVGVVHGHENDKFTRPTHYDEMKMH